MFSSLPRRLAWFSALVGVAAMGSASLAHQRQYEASLRAVHESLAVQASIGETLSLLKDAETGQRGYLLTGDVAFLAPYTKAISKMNDQLAELSKLVASDAQQTESAHALRDLAREKLAELAQTITLRQHGRQDEALAIVHEGRGRRWMVAIRGRANDMLTREAKSLAEREIAAEGSRKRLNVTLACVWGFFVLGVGAGLWQAARGVAQARRANARLVETEKSLRAVADNATDLVRILGNADELVYTSPSCERLLGYSQSEMVEMPPRALLHEEELRAIGELTARLRAGQATNEPCVHRLRTKDGSYRWFETTSCLVPASSEGDAHIHLTSRDIDDRRRADEEQRRAEKNLQESEQRLRVLSEASFEGVAITKGGVLVDTNSNLASWLGYEPEALLGMDGLSLFAPDDRDFVSRVSAESEAFYEAHMLRKDGTQFPVEVRGRFITVNGEKLRIAVVRDTTDKRRREAELKQQAELLRAMSLRDELTGLYNRRGFLEHAQQSLRLALRAQRPACVFFADLNGMKAINDTLGHESGDRAIASTAKVLKSVFRESDIVARLGGDEFAIYAADCTADDVARVRTRLAQRVADVNRDGAEPFQLSISVGAAVFDPSAPLDLDSLMASADQRMYDEKRARVAAPRTEAKARTGTG